MKTYLRWSLRQFYLLVFLPTQFRREVKDDRTKKRLGFKQRFLYVLKMLPWIAALTVLGNLIGRHAIQLFGIELHWGTILPFLVSSVAFGVMFGVATGVATGVAFGVAPGFANVVGAFVVRAGVGIDVAASVGTGVGLGVGVGAVLGVVLGVRGSVALGVAFGVILGVILGVDDGVRPGVAFGVAFPLAFWLTYFRLCTYPFDVVLATFAYFRGRRKPKALLRAWRWCPVVWNEVIWLPLPFVSKLLVLLVRQDREEGFRQIAFVAAERQLQRRAARTALVEVALDDLGVKSLTELAGATEKLRWTTDAPAELPAELTTSLPRFDRAAQHVGQYFTLQSPFRRAEALDRALEEVEALQRTLITARGATAPRLLRSANEWGTLLRAERAAFRTQLEAAQEIPNPFIFGKPVNEQQANVFGGRQDIVRQVEASLLGAQQSPTLLLYGPRRMGKSSILNQLPRLLGPDFAPALLDCQNPAVTGSAATLLRYLTRTLGDALQRRRVSVEPLRKEALEREPFAAFDEWLDAAERAMPEKMRALLCLDEYEHLQRTLDAGWGAAFLDTLRHTLQHRSKIALMFIGSHTFEEQGPAWTDRFLSARRVRVSFLTRAEVIPLLTKPIPEFDMTYSPGALESLLDATNGQPFLTQAVAFELVQLLNEQHRKEASVADVEAAIARALESGSEYFANVWYDAGAEGQAILQALARHETPPDFPKARTWLREHDVLNNAGSFAVPMVERWVARKVC